MKRFTIKITAGVVIVVWGFICMDFTINVTKIKDQKIEAKLKLFESYKKTKDVDLVFIGSSLFATGINCEVIDSLTGKTSFNLGISGLGNSYQKYEFVKNLIKTGLIENGTTIVLELGLYDDYYFEMSQDFNQNDRALALYSSSSYLEDVKTFWKIRSSTYFSTAKVGYELTKLYLNSRYKFNFHHTSAPAITKKEALKRLEKGARGDMFTFESGFTPYKALTYLPQKNVNRYNERTKDTKNQMLLNSKIYPSEKNIELGGVFSKRYIDLAKQLKRKNGDLIVIALPMAFRPSNERFVKFTLPGMNIKTLDLENPSKFPCLYKREIYFDVAHLNRDGAADLSRTIGEILARQNDGNF